jgi:hypothetical protein
LPHFDLVIPDVNPALGFVAQSPIQRNIAGRCNGLLQSLDGARFSQLMGLGQIGAILQPLDF